MTAFGAHKDIFGVPDIFRHKVTGEKIERFAAMTAFCGLHPEKIFNVRFRVAANFAASAVKVPQFTSQSLSERIGRRAIILKIQGFHLLTHNPVGHRIDIAAPDVCPHAVCLKQRGATPHEGIGNSFSSKITRLVKGFFQREVGKFGEHEGTEQSTRPSGKPFMHGNNRTVILLNLLLPPSKVCHKSYVVTVFYHLG